MVNNGFQTVEPTSQFDDILRQFLDTPGILAAIDRLRPTHPVAHPPDPAPVRTVGTVMVTAEHANRAEANRQRAVACRELIDSTPVGSPTYLSLAWLSDNSSTPPSGSPVWRFDLGDPSGLGWTTLAKRAAAHVEATAAAGIGRKLGRPQGSTVQPTKSKVLELTWPQAHDLLGHISVEAAVRVMQCSTGMVINFDMHRRCRTCVLGMCYGQDPPQATHPLPTGLHIVAGVCYLRSSWPEGTELGRQCLQLDLHRPAHEA